MANPQKKSSSIQSNPSLLGHYAFRCQRFENLDQIFKEFHTKAFTALHTRKRFKKINETLLRLIQEAPEPAFLLAAAIEFIDRVNHERLLSEPYKFVDFEFWLNNFSDLNDQDNYHVRGKIAGKYIPREEYQTFFPIGMGKKFSGTHFVTAHISPDVDTTIASFSGWLDAFSCRVSDGLNIWSLPGGAPDSHITHIMQEMFGEGIFANTVRTSGTLSVTSMDLLTQKELSKVTGSISTATIDHAENSKAVILVDDEGHYLGDWRTSDVETVRQVVRHFSTLLRWFENNLHVKLISLFSKPKPRVEDLPPFLSSVFDLTIQDCEPVRELNETQQQHLHTYLHAVLGVIPGIHATFGELSTALEHLHIAEFADFKKNVESLSNPELFDKLGALIEDRPKIFHYLHQILNSLDNAIQSVRMYIDRLDVMMAIKHKVLGQSPQYITLRSDVEEIRTKMKNYTHLTVVIPEKEGKWFAVGMVKASDLRLPVLGTVSLRDFCNLEEIKMASYLEVISVVDHHKSSLKTSTAPQALIGDAQSCNVLVAEATMRINERYSAVGMSAKELAEENLRLAKLEPSPESSRLQYRLLQRQIAAFNRKDYYVHPLREFTEYLCFLYAILDDTDLLSKVSNRDVECVAHLLNTLKSISIHRDIEVITLDDIPKNSRFAKTAAKRILQNEEMYSLYKKIYDYKEQEVEKNLHLCAEGKPSNIFADTKEQNGCAYVGQIKLFASNYPFFEQNSEAFRKQWLAEAMRTYAEQPQLDLYMQMTSTITGADEVHSGNAGKYAHKDEMWIWIPTTQLATEHLTNFLNAFSNAPEIVKNNIEVEFLGTNAADLEEIFIQNFRSIPRKTAATLREDFPIAILRYNAGSINSRKSMITPYLPRLIS